MSIMDIEAARLPGDYQRKDPDLVKVTRCEHCAMVLKQSNVAFCSHFSCYMDLDGFCNYGRPREEG